MSGDKKELGGTIPPTNKDKAQGLLNLAMMFDDLTFQQRYNFIRALEAMLNEWVAYRNGADESGE